jgi:hypothetical protein
LNAEYDFFDPIQTYVVYGENHGTYTRRQLVDTFGGWIPLTNYGTGYDFLAAMDVELGMLVFRERRKRRDGIIEVNMESRVEVPREKMREELGKLSAEIK